MNASPSLFSSHLNEWFQMPTESSVAAFARAQVELYRHNPTLQDYFLPLQLSFCKNRTIDPVPQSLSRRIYASSCRMGSKVFRRVSRRKIKVDVLLCPMLNFQRRTENQFLMRMFTGLVQTGASILCLLPKGAPCRAEMESWLRAEGRKNQVIFWDLSSISNPLAARMLSILGRSSGAQMFNEIVEVLRPHGMAPAIDSQSGFFYTAAHAESWRFFEHDIEFDAVVTRCHWQTLCSAVCQTARQRGKPVITFQQGVIGHTLDVPVLASKFVAFGDSSARFLAQMNRSFYQAVNRAEPVVEFIPGGCLFDTIPSLPGQFLKQTLLIFDEPVGPDDFYGIRPQRDAVLQLAERVLETCASARIIIRPHPYWDSMGLGFWKDLVRKYPNRCELSHAAWTLEEDLSRSSVALGVFSGALTIASGAGLPTFFMVADSGYKTKDLASFEKGQLCMPEAAFDQISRVLTNAQAHAEAGFMALKNARDYYANGANLEMSPAFFERLLHPTASPSVARQE